MEGERVEYKAGWNPDAILRTLCAFANDFENLSGGYVVIGQDCDAEGMPVFPPAGLPIKQLDRIQRELLGFCNLIQPPFFPFLSVERFEGRNLLVLWAPGGQNPPYQVPRTVTAKTKDYRYYIRRYASTVEAKGDDERELISLTARVPFDDRFNREAGIGDLSLRLMNDFLREVKSDLAGETHGLSPESLGRQMNVVGGSTETPLPKNVGLLLFNENPARFFPATQIDVVWFPQGAGGDRFEEKTFEGPLARITRDALSFIRTNYLKQTVIKHPDRAEAERLWNFPYAAIEEAVVNAVYHRSYEIREPIEVRITPEELVVLSFPGPDRSIRLADLRKGKAVSRRYRNRRIGEFLKELNLTEGRSTGISKIIKAMAANGSPPPEFETDDDRTFYLIRLPVHLKAEFGEDSVASSGQSSGKGLGRNLGKVSGKILALMIINPIMTIPEMAIDLGISTRAVEKQIAKLKDAGFVTRNGADKNGQWEIHSLEGLPENSREPESSEKSPVKNQVKSPVKNYRSGLGKGSGRSSVKKGR